MSSPAKPVTDNTAPPKAETSASVKKVEVAASSQHEVKAPAPSPMLRTPSSSASVKPAVERSKSTEPKGPVSGEERSRLIAEAAYYIAEKRHFQGGDPAQDWIQAEQDVDSRLFGRR
jgi:hypothetical protein